MKLIIMSDNHNNIKAVEEIYTRHFKEADLFLHCGDSQLPYNHPLLSKFLKVGGNCDYDRSYPKELTKDLTENHRLFMTHGHHYDVKMSLDRLWYKGLETGANIVCFGHSHCVEVEMIKHILFINPGSVTFPRNTREKTYATLTIAKEKLIVNILQTDHGKVLKTYEFLQ